jgi:hypothetical protein
MFTGETVANNIQKFDPDVQEKTRHLSSRDNSVNTNIWERNADFVETPIKPINALVGQNFVFTGC